MCKKPFPKSVLKLKNEMHNGLIKRIVEMFFFPANSVMIEYKTVCMKRIPFATKDSDNGVV